MLAKNGNILKYKTISYVNRRFSNYVLMKILVAISLKCIICSAAVFKDSSDKGNEATRL